MGTPDRSDVITLDTSAVLALVNARDPNHSAAAVAVSSASAECVLPMSILSEVGYMIERWMSQTHLTRFLDRIVTGAVNVRCGEDDFSRIGELVTRYSSLPLGFSDAAVVACAEHTGGQVLSFDRRDFDVVARGGTITLV